MCFLLVFSKSANAVVLRQDAVIGIILVIALITLNGL